MDPLVKILDVSDHDCILVQSGQHYDFEMVDIFFSDLKLRRPDFKLDVGSGSHSQQMARMLVLYESLFDKTKPDLILALGDTNTVVATGFSAIKQQIPFGHVEAGLRSFDFLMPEEINRRIADMCAVVNFAPSEVAALNLLYEGIPPTRIFVTGNTGIDSVLKYTKIAKKTSKIFQQLDISNKESYILLTVHRPKNVDNARNLTNIAKAIEQIDQSVIFSIHPRTRVSLNRYGLLEQLNSLENLIICKPLGYLDFLALLNRASVIMTDSGGLQEEALALQVPCVTLRENTERPETVEMGVNVLVNCNPDQIIKSVNFMLENNESVRDRLKSIQNPYGDGRAAEKVLAAIDFLWEKAELKYESPNFISTIHPTRHFELTRVSNDLSIGEFERKNDVEVSLIYDKTGKPHFPRLNSVLKKDWTARLLVPPRRKTSSVTDNHLKK